MSNLIHGLSKNSIDSKDAVILIEKVMNNLSTYNDDELIFITKNSIVVDSDYDNKIHILNKNIIFSLKYIQNGSNNPYFELIDVNEFEKDPPKYYAIHAKMSLGLFCSLLLNNSIEQLEKKHIKSFHIMNGF
jgi:hypothetical protein